LKVFISYRHVAPDQEFAQFLGARLSACGHDAFLDVGMLIGTRWVEEIESQIAASEFFVILISKDSILSDLVRREVELAHSLASKGKLTILPIRLGFAGELPYDLAAYLNPIQYTYIEPGKPYDPVCDQIIAAVEHFQALPTLAPAVSRTGMRALIQATDHIGAPLPAADPRMETGAIAPSSPFYVRRTADNAVEQALHGNGCTVVVKGPRQSGKSSLLARICASANAGQKRVCYIDLQLLDHGQFASLGVLLRHMAWKIARVLKTQMKPEPWEDNLGHKEMLTAFIEDGVLGDSKGTAVFVLDEVDRVFDYPYRDDFFALMRAWHNRRATQYLWGRVSLVLSHSTDPALWIQDMNQSPFNVGERVDLEDFDAEQIADLSLRHGLLLDRNRDLKNLQRLVGGQPYLVRQALYTLATRHWPVSTLDEAACDERGPFGDHLRQFHWRLQRDPVLKRALEDILKKGICERDTDFQRLKAAGLVSGASCRRAQMRCGLYDRYFRSQLE